MAAKPPDSAGDGAATTAEVAAPATGHSGLRRSWSAVVATATPTRTRPSASSGLHAAASSGALNRSDGATSAHKEALRNERREITRVRTEALRSESSGSAFAGAHAQASASASTPAQSSSSLQSSVVSHEESLVSLLSPTADVERKSVVPVVVSRKKSAPVVPQSAMREAPKWLQQQDRSVVREAHLQLPIPLSFRPYTVHADSCTCTKPSSSSKHVGGGSGSASSEQAAAWCVLQSISADHQFKQYSFEEIRYVDTMGHENVAPVPNAAVSDATAAREHPECYWRCPMSTDYTFTGICDRSTGGTTKPQASEVVVHTVNHMMSVVAWPRFSSFSPEEMRFLRCDSAQHAKGSNSSDTSDAASQSVLGSAGTPTGSFSATEPIVPNTEVKTRSMPQPLLPDYDSSFPRLGEGIAGRSKMIAKDSSDLPPMAQAKDVPRDHKKEEVASVYNKGETTVVETKVGQEQQHQQEQQKQQEHEEDDESDATAGLSVYSSGVLPWHTSVPTLLSTVSESSSCPQAQSQPNTGGVKEVVDGAQTALPAGSPTPTRTPNPARTPSSGTIILNRQPLRDTTPSGWIQLLLRSVSGGDHWSVMMERDMLIAALVETASHTFSVPNEYILLSFDDQLLDVHQTPTQLLLVDKQSIELRFDPQWDSPTPEGYLLARRTADAQVRPSKPGASHTLICSPRRKGEAWSVIIQTGFMPTDLQSRVTLSAVSKTFRVACLSHFSLLPFPIPLSTYCHLSFSSTSLAKLATWAQRISNKPYASLIHTGPAGFAVLMLANHVFLLHPMLGLCLGVSAQTKTYLWTSGYDAGRGLLVVSWAADLLARDGADLRVEEVKELTADEVKPVLMRLTEHLPKEYAEPIQKAAMKAIRRVEQYQSTMDVTPLLSHRLATASLRPETQQALKRLATQCDARTVLMQLAQLDWGVVCEKLQKFTDDLLKKVESVRCSYAKGFSSVDYFVMSRARASSSSGEQTVGDTSSSSSNSSSSSSNSSSSSSSSSSKSSKAVSQSGPTDTGGDTKSNTAPPDTSKSGISNSQTNTGGGGSSVSIDNGLVGLGSSSASASSTTVKSSSSSSDHKSGTEKGKSKIRRTALTKRKKSVNSMVDVLDETSKKAVKAVVVVKGSSRKMTDIHEVSSSSSSSSSASSSTQSSQLPASTSGRFSNPRRRAGAEIVCRPGELVALTPAALNTLIQEAVNRGRAQESLLASGVTTLLYSFQDEIRDTPELQRFIGMHAHNDFFHDFFHDTVNNWNYVISLMKKCELSPVMNALDEFEQRYQQRYHVLLAILGHYSFGRLAQLGARLSPPLQPLVSEKEKRSGSKDEKKHAFHAKLRHPVSRKTFTLFVYASNETTIHVQTSEDSNCVHTYCGSAKEALDRASQMARDKMAEGYIGSIESKALDDAKRKAQEEKQKEAEAARGLPEHEVLLQCLRAVVSSEPALEAFLDVESKAKELRGNDSYLSDITGIAVCMMRSGHLCRGLLLAAASIDEGLKRRPGLSLIDSIDSITGHLNHRLTHALHRRLSDHESDTAEVAARHDGYGELLYAVWWLKFMAVRDHATFKYLNRTLALQTHVLRLLLARKLRPLVARTGGGVAAAAAAAPMLVLGGFGEEKKEAGATSDLMAHLEYVFPDTSDNDGFREAARKAIQQQADALERTEKASATATDPFYRVKNMVRLVEVPERKKREMCLNCGRVHGETDEEDNYDDEEEAEDEEEEEAEDGGEMFDPFAAMLGMLAHGGRMGPPFFF